MLYLGARPELSVSFLRVQGFRTAWKDDPREVHFLYANSYEREAAAQLFEKWLETEHFTSVGGADQEDADMLAEE